MNDTAKVTQTALDKEMAELRKMVAEHKAFLKNEEAKGSVDTVPKLMYDPYDLRQDFLAIIGDIAPCEEFPEGAAVKWVNPNLRNRSSAWMGYEPFEYGDAYTGENGELLEQYIVAAPLRMQKPNEIDSYVRRSDLILCRIDKRVKDARMFNREARNSLQRTKGADPKSRTIQRGVSIVGEGMVDSTRPAKGFQFEEPEIPALPATVQDAEHAEKGGVFRTNLRPKLTD